jgi:hypothetical protein
VQLELAAPFGLADDPAPPELKSLWLDWPGLASYRRVLLLVEDQDGVMQPHPLVFDPASKRLQWGGLRFFRRKSRGERAVRLPGAADGAARARAGRAAGA